MPLAHVATNIPPLRVSPDDEEPAELTKHSAGSFLLYTGVPSHATASSEEISSP
jgi:hypothetical protein